MLKSVIINRAADHIANRRNPFDWRDVTHCTVGILVRIACGTEKKMMTPYSLSKEFSAIVCRMTFQGCWDRPKGWPTWSCLHSYERSALDFSPMTKKMASLGFNSMELAEAEHLEGFAIRAAAGLEDEEPRPGNRRQVVKYLRQWAKMECGAEQYKQLKLEHVSGRSTPILAELAGIS